MIVIDVQQPHANTEGSLALRDVPIGDWSTLNKWLPQIESVYFTEKAQTK